MIALRHSVPPLALRHSVPPRYKKAGHRHHDGTSIGGAQDHEEHAEMAANDTTQPYDPNATQPYDRDAQSDVEAKEAADDSATEPGTPSVELSDAD